MGFWKDLGISADSVSFLEVARPQKRGLSRPARVPADNTSSPSLALPAGVAAASLWSTGNFATGQGPWLPATPGREVEPGSH